MIVSYFCEDSSEICTSYYLPTSAGVPVSLPACFGGTPVATLPQNRFFSIDILFLRVLLYILFQPIHISLLYVLLSVSRLSIYTTTSTLDTLHINTYTHYKTNIVVFNEIITTIIFVLMEERKQFSAAELF